MKKLFKIVAILLVASAAFAGLSSCNKGKKEAAVAIRKPDADGLFTLRLTKSSVFNVNALAELRGFFAEEGIKIEWVGSVEGLSRYQMLEQGLLDVIGAHPTEAAQARLAGVRFIGTSPEMVDHPQYPHARYIVSANSPIKSLDDIVGKKVTIQSYMSCYEGYLKYYLITKGIKGDVEWVVLGAGGSGEQALVQGLVDMTTSHPPYASLAIQAGAKQLATSWDILQTPGAGLYLQGFREDFIAQYPEIVRAHARALLKGRNYIDENMERALKDTSEVLGIDPDTVSVEWDGRWFEETPFIRPEYIEEWFKLSEALGYWKHGDIKPTDIYTNDYAPAPLAKVSEPPVVAVTSASSLQ